MITKPLTLAIAFSLSLSTIAQSAIPSTNLISINNNLIAQTSGNCSKFIKDDSYPDGTKVKPGQTFLKTWSIQNCGSTQWNSNYKAVKVSGSFGPNSFAIGSVNSGKTTQLSTTFIAPNASGTYRVTYRLQDASGRFFGTNFWVEVAVTSADLNGKKFTISEYLQRLYGHNQGVSATNRQWEKHQAIDSNVTGNASKSVRALVGGEVISAKTGVALTGVNGSVNSGIHPTLGRVTASNYNAEVVIWNAELNRRFIYLHFSEVRVKKGDKVNPGDIIGIEGSTGWSTGLHTHMAVFQGKSGSSKEDPLVTLGNARAQSVLDKKYR